MTAQVSAESVLARLVALAHERGQQPELLMTRYAVERLLYRLSISAHRERFVLKGALLFDLWFDQAHRPTRDADLLGYGDADAAMMVAVFGDIADIEVDDAVQFDSWNLAVVETREQANYPGLRVRLLARMAQARFIVQVDIGFGDAIAEPPDVVDFPCLLTGMPAPRLRVYPKESVLAEKLHILTQLGIANSRLKDYYDLWTLGQQADFDFVSTAQAVAATFARRATKLAERVPIGLEAEFANDPAKQAQWRGFLKRTGLQAPSLVEVVSYLAGFLGPLVLASSDRHQGLVWRDGGPWRPSPQPKRNARESP